LIRFFGAWLPFWVWAADLWSLSSQTIALRLKSPRHAWAGGLGTSSPAIFAGDRRLSAWEARWEILRRTTDYLEERGG
jgi:hypothetical protein